MPSGRKRIVVRKPGETAVFESTRTLTGTVTFNSTQTVPAGEVWQLDPNVSTTVTFTAGSLVVNGTLRSRPATAAVEHAILFTGVDETAFVGGGTVVLAETDRGLWVDDDGLLDMVGVTRTPWLRAAADIAAGATSFTLESAPVGWLPGDVIVITPTVATSTASWWTKYDERVIQSVVGSTVTVTAALTNAHPRKTIDAASALYLGAEVLNLTRNIRIEGTPSGRAHTIFVGTQPQRISYVGYRYMGPRKLTGEAAITANVLGRYAFHFQMVGDTSRGSMLVGLVDRDSGGHSFVPHESHGITFDRCISHNTFDEPFWYDLGINTFTDQMPSHDITFQHCVASLVKVDPSYRGFLLAGFVLGNGARNRCVGCVAVGIQGSASVPSGNSSGYHWPESAGGNASGQWAFTDCVAHNNICHGLHTWQNNVDHHLITEFKAYNNGKAGISHGAYVNGYDYAQSHCIGNKAGIEIHANSHSAAVQALTFQGIKIDCESRGPYAVEVVKHTLVPGGTTRVIGVDMAGYTTAAVGFSYTGSNGATTRDLIDFTDCTKNAGLPTVEIVGVTTPGQLEPGSLVRWIVGGSVVESWTG